MIHLEASEKRSHQHHLDYLHILTLCFDIFSFLISAFPFSSAFRKWDILFWTDHIAFGAFRRISIYLVFHKNVRIALRTGKTQ